jgi:hypothetical protein
VSLLVPGVFSFQERIENFEFFGRILMLGVGLDNNFDECLFVTKDLLLVGIEI